MPAYENAKERKEAKKRRREAKMAEIRLTPEWEERHSAATRQWEATRLLLSSLNFYRDTSKLMTRGTAILDSSGEVVNVKYRRNSKSARESTKEREARLSKGNNATARREELQRKTVSVSFDVSAAWSPLNASAAFYLRTLRVPLSFAIIRPCFTDAREKETRPLPHVLPIEPTRLLRDIRSKTEVVIPNP